MTKAILAQVIIEYQSKLEISGFTLSAYSYICARCSSSLHLGTLANEQFAAERGEVPVGITIRVDTWPQKHKGFGGIMGWRPFDVENRDQVDSIFAVQAGIAAMCNT